MQRGTIIEYRQKDGDITYRVQYRDSRGVQVKETIGRKSEGWTKRKIEKELVSRINRVANKKWAKPKPVLFKDYAERWYTESEKPRNWKQATLKTYRYALNKVNDRFGHKRLSDISRSEINGAVSEWLAKGFAARSVSLMLTILHSVFERAVDEGLVDANPVNRANRPKLPRYKPRPLTVAEAREVESKIADPTVRLAFVTFELLGIRFNELRALRWRDVDFVSKRLRIEDSKTPQGERSLSIPAPLVEKLIEHLDRTAYKSETDFVFCHKDKGSKLDPAGYRNTVTNAVKAVGITERFRPAHDLRVTSLTAGVLANEHPVKLMARAGHTNYETTKKYIELAGQVFPEEAETLAAMRLGKTEAVEEAT